MWQAQKEAKEASAAKRGYDQKKEVEQRRRLARERARTKVLNAMVSEVLSQKMSQRQKEVIPQFHSFTRHMHSMGTYTKRLTFAL